MRAPRRPRPVAHRLLLPAQDARDDGPARRPRNGRDPGRPTLGGVLRPPTTRGHHRRDTGLATDVLREKSVTTRPPPRVRCAGSRRDAQRQRRRSRRATRSAPSRGARAARRRAAASTPAPASTRPTTAKPPGSATAASSSKSSPKREILDGRALCERHALQLDHAANARAAREVAGVDGDAVGDVEHRVRVAPSSFPRRCGAADGRTTARGTRHRPRRAGRSRRARRPAVRPRVPARAASARSPSR